MVIADRRRGSQTLVWLLFLHSELERLARTLQNDSERTHLGLGKSTREAVDDSTTYPQIQRSAVYMGRLRKSTHHVSLARSWKEWRYRRNSSVFPSIPTPYYDDYDHVYIS